eukprot:UN05327
MLRLNNKAMIKCKHLPSSTFFPIFCTSQVNYTRLSCVVSDPF